jgi:hypothetical protein
LSEAASAAEGPGIEAGVHSRETWFRILPRDKYGNDVTVAGPESFAVVIVHEDGTLQDPTKIGYDLTGWTSKYSPISVGTSTYLLRVQINFIHIAGSPFSVNMRPPVATTSAPQKTFASGRATQRSRTGESSVFTVQAVDSFGAYQSIGGAEISAEMVLEDYFLRLEPRDNSDGTYTFQYLVTMAGRYKMAVLLRSGESIAHISGSPFEVLLIPSEISAVGSHFVGEGISGVVAGQEGSFIIDARDRFGNKKYQPSASVPLEVLLRGPTELPASIKDFRDGTFFVTYNVTVSGRYAIHIVSQSDSAQLALLVMSASPWAKTSYIDLSLLTVKAGEDPLLPISIRDFYSNVIVPPDSSSELTSIQCTILDVGPMSVIAKNGNFLLAIKMTSSGKYQLALMVASSPASSSPYPLQIVEADFSAVNTIVSGTDLEHVADRASLLMLRPKDHFGNAIEANSSDVALTLLPLTSIADLSSQFSIRGSGNVLHIDFTASRPCQACNLSIQIGGAHVRGSPFLMSINPAEPPVLKAAIFISHLAGATVTFDRPTDKGGSNVEGFFNCGSILELNSYRMAGNNSQCAWTSSTSFIIMFDKGATLLPDSHIFIRENAVMSTRRNSRFASGSVRLLVPHDAMSPEPIIDGPAMISPCDSLTMDASSTYGDGGRDMIFQWGLTFGPPNRADVMSIILALPSTQRVLTIPNGTLLPATRYNFTLKVQNFVEQQKSVSFPVFVASTETPQVLIIGRRLRETLSSRAIALRGQAALSTCTTAADSGIDFSWTQISGAQIAPWPAQSIKTSSSLYLPQNTLVPGQKYTMRVSAVLSNNPMGSSFADVSIQVISSPVLAVIDGGDRTHSTGLDLTLDASRSSDPDGSLQPFTFTWSCSPDPCFDDVSGLLVLNEAVRNIPAGTLTPGEFVFTVSVSKDPGPRTSQASVRISIKPGAVSSVSASLNGVGRVKVSADRRLVLTGQVRSCSASRQIPCNPTYKWSIVNGNIDPSKSSTDLVSPNLVLLGDVLVRGQTFVLELSGACESERSGSSRLTVQVDFGPVGGTFTATPTEGTALKTIFSLECSRWIDLLENLPLSYMYRATIWGRINQLSGHIASSKLDVLMSPPTNLTNTEILDLDAKICNSFGSCTVSSTMRVLVQEDKQPSSPMVLLSMVSKAQGVGNTEMVVGASRAIFNQMNIERGKRRLQSEDRRQDVEVRRKLLSSLAQVSTTVVTQESVSFLSNALQSSMKAKDLEFTDIHEAGMDMVQSLLKTSVKLEEVSDSAAQNLGATLSDIVQAVSKQGSQRRIAQVVNVYDQVQLHMTTLGHARMLDRVPYEAPLMIQTDNFEHTSGRFHNQQLRTGTVLTSTKCLAGVCNSAILSPSLPLGLDLVDAQLLVWGTERHSKERELIVSNVTSVQILNGATVWTGVLDRPLQVLIPLRPSAHTEKLSGEYIMPVCQYWDADRKAWKSAGCLAVGSRGDSLECACFHTTDFAGLFRSTILELGRSDQFLNKMGNLVGAQVHHIFVILSICVTSLLATILVIIGNRYDVAVSKSYAPSLRASLFQRGYLHAATKRFERRFRSLFLDLWSRRTAHLIRTHHGILGIFFRQPKDPYDRPARLACVSIHVIACMCLNIIWLGAVGFPDANMVTVGIFTGLILMPIQPMCSAVFKTVTPAERDRRRKKKTDVKPKKADVPPPNADVPPPRLASRRSRVEVAGTVEAVDNTPPGTGQDEITQGPQERGQDELTQGPQATSRKVYPEPPAEPRPSVPPSRRIDYDRLQDAIPRTFEYRGPRTPEVFLNYSLSLD